METATGEAPSSARPDSTADSAQLYVEVERPEDGRVTMLRLVGTVNAYTAPMVKARVEDAVKHGVWSLVVSLADVDQVDPEVTVGMLLRTLRRMQSNDGYMVIADPGDLVRRPIKARGLALVLAVFTAEEAAVEFLTSWRRTA